MFCGLRKSLAPRLGVSLLMLVIPCLAAKEFVKPKAEPAVNYPAHDQHKDEGVTSAVDPYDMPEKAQIFAVNYREQGLLPILLVITNDSDRPISLADMKTQLVTVSRVKIAPCTSDEIYRRLSHPSASTTAPYPLPFPRRKVKGGVSGKAWDEIQSASFSAKAVEPHSTQSGFLFFDVAGIDTPLAGAHFYLTGVRNGTGDELLYFEIPLENYLTAPATKTK